MFLAWETLEIAILALLNRIPLLILLSISWVTCTDLSEYDTERIKEALGDSLITSAASSNIKMDIIEDGALKLNLKSARALTITEDREKTTYLSGPIYISIYENSVLDTEVLSDSAIYFPKVAQFELFGNVEVYTSSGRKLFSDYLKWIREKDEVSTPGSVLIITESDSIAANGFIGNTSLTDYTLTSVTGKTQFN